MGNVVTLDNDYSVEITKSISKSQVIRVCLKIKQTSRVSRNTNMHSKEQVQSVCYCIFGKDIQQAEKKLTAWGRDYSPSGDIITKKVRKWKEVTRTI